MDKYRRVGYGSLFSNTVVRMKVNLKSYRNRNSYRVSAVVATRVLFEILYRLGISDSACGLSEAKYYMDRVYEG